MVSIIILSYNTKEYLSSCLQSIYKYVSHTPYEVIVIDNDSSDRSAEMIEKDFKKVRLTKSKENLGFAKGANLGAKQAKGEYLLFLNSDTTFINDAIQLLYRSIQIHKGGIVGGRMLNLDGTTQRSFGNFYDLLHVAQMLFGGDSAELLHVPKTQSRVDWVSGGFMLIRKDVFDKLKGFDENFFMYIEDMELCFRARKFGYKTYYCPEAIIKHIGHGSSNRQFAIVHIYKGLLYHYKKHYSPLQYGVLKILLITKAVVAFFTGVVTSNPQLQDTYKKALSLTL